MNDQHVKAKYFKGKKGVFCPNINRDQYKLEIVRPNIKSLVNNSEQIFLEKSQNNSYKVTNE